MAGWASPSDHKAETMTEERRDALENSRKPALVQDSKGMDLGIVLPLVPSVLTASKQQIAA